MCVCVWRRGGRKEFEGRDRRTKVSGIKEKGTFLLIILYQGKHFTDCCPLVPSIPFLFRGPEAQGCLLIGLSLMHLCNIPVQNDV